MITNTAHIQSIKCTTAKCELAYAAHDERPKEAGGTALSWSQPS
jgi:hypothetical protein